jgi:ABC-2 type transport system ATP-binding protein
MQEVEAMCSRAIIVNFGKIVADDSTGHLLSANQDSEIILVEFDHAVKPDDLMKIKGVIHAVSVAGNVFQVEAGTDADVRPELFRFAVDKGIAVLSMQKQSSRLEDVFQQLTRK